MPHFVAQHEQLAASADSPNFSSMLLDSVPTCSSSYRWRATLHRVDLPAKGTHTLVPRQPDFGNHTLEAPGSACRRAELCS